MISLRTRLVAFYAAVVTLTVALAAGTGFWLIKRELFAGIDFLLDAESKEILSRIKEWVPPGAEGNLASALEEHVEMDSVLYYFQAHDKKGSVLFRSPNLGEYSLPDLTGGPDKRTVRLGSLGNVRVAEYYLPRLDVQIAMSLRHFRALDVRFAEILVSGLPAVALLSVGAGLVLSRFTFRPLRNMQQAAGRISATNLSERVPVPAGRDELVALAKLLNEMFDRLERSFIQIKRFTADTSHELLTPLSVIRLHAERLLQDHETPANIRQPLEEQFQSILHLEDTLERLLVLTKADSNALPLNLVTCSTREFISQFAEDARLLAESHALQFFVEQNEDAVATFDQGWIRQVLFNLLSNALRFSQKGGCITLSSSCADSYWRVEVKDEGIGVPPQRLSEIFERFVQITPRSEPGSGAGLGLAICKSIVELHEGRIEALNRLDRSGLVVRFALPLRGPAAWNSRRSGARAAESARFSA